MPSTKRPPNIHRSIAAVCRRLGLEPSQVHELVITPTSVRARVYKLNDNGAKYIDRELDKVASEIKRFKVRA